MPDAFKYGPLTC